jgi:hypothetical protein
MEARHSTNGRLSIRYRLPQELSERSAIGAFSDNRFKCAQFVLVAAAAIEDNSHRRAAIIAKGELIAASGFEVARDRNPPPRCIGVAIRNPVPPIRSALPSLPATASQQKAFAL